MSQIVEMLESRWRQYGAAEAFVAPGSSVSFSEFLQLSDQLYADLLRANIPRSSPVLISGDITPESIALLWACIRHNCICIPHLSSNTSALEKRVEIAVPEWGLSVENNIADSAIILVSKKLNSSTTPQLYQDLAKEGSPGLVLFTSGTSGEPKAALHNLELLFQKFNKTGRPLRTLGFLLFDHWGGLNTVFHTLNSGGVLGCIDNRSPSEICRFIEKNAIELLPVSPSFLNLLLASGSYRKFNLSSLKLMTYGSEPMPAETLKVVRLRFPNVSFKQTYGLIELGVFSTKNKDEGSLFFKIDKKQAEYRIVDNLLQIKAKSAMLGYLNAPSPFTSDGWFITGDEVRTDGNFIRVLGRKSELINVGGEKVFPVEVENFLLSIDDVIDARVFGEENALLGTIVCAEIHCRQGTDRTELTNRIKKMANFALSSYKVPVKISFSNNTFLGARLKKKRV